jgi:pimeloyl-ACP methyl ester carboxylesterase
VSDAISYTRRGSGEPLLLIHGLGGEKCVWDPVLEPLAERYDVIAVDLPGFGRSKPLPDGTAPTARALAAAIWRLLEELGTGTPHVAGNSLGGWVALELAVAGRARSVTGLCPAGLWSAPVMRPGDPEKGRGQRAARRLRPLIPVALLVPPLRRLVLSPFVAHPERVPYRDAWRMISSYARATAYAATSTAMRQGRFDDADAVEVPVTLAFGERDRLIRPARTRIRGARTVTLPDCGHIPMWDATELVVDVIAETAARGSDAATSARVSAGGRSAGR